MVPSETIAGMDIGKTVSWIQLALWIIAVPSFVTRIVAKRKQGSKMMPSPLRSFLSSDYTIGIVIVLGLILSFITLIQRYAPPPLTMVIRSIPAPIVKIFQTSASPTTPHNHPKSSGPTIGSIKQGDCGVVQNGGSNNSASPNCVPPIRKLTDEQKRGIEEFLETIPPSVQIMVSGVFGSGDANLYAGEFLSLIGGKHSGNQSVPLIKVGIPATFTGVWVVTRTEDDSAKLYRDEFVKKLNSLGISTRAGNGGDISAGTLEILIGFRPEEVK